MGLDFERNVGGLDRVTRGVLAVVLAGIGLWATVTSQWVVGLLAFVAAAGFTFNVVTGFCGVNAVLGVDTCGWDGANEAKSDDAG